MLSTWDKLALRFDRLDTGPTSARDAFKEWHHFNLCDHTNKIYGFFNIGLAGNAQAFDRSAGLVVYAVHTPESGWIGHVESIDSSRLVRAANGVGLAVGEHTLRYRAGAYCLDIGGPHHRVQARLEFRTCGPLLPVRRRASFGDGTADWIVAPDLNASGRLVVDGHPFDCQGNGYHDHNRGDWLWNEAVWWVWGFAHSPGPPPGRIAIVFDSTCATRSAVGGSQQIVVVTVGGRVFKLFLDDEVELSLHPPFATTTTRLSSAMSFLAAHRAASPPRTMTVAARHGSDRLRITLTTLTAVEVLIPRHARSGFTSVLEVLARCRVQGSIAGQPIAFGTTTFFEYVR